MAPGHFHVNTTDAQLKWSRDVPPVAIVDQNQNVTFDLLDSAGRQITRDSTASDVAKIDISTCDPIFGPVYIKGAEPGDVLECEFIKLETADWGFTAVAPGFGLLADDFPDPALKIFSWTQADSHIQFCDGIRIPKRPFLGISGVSPGDVGEFSTIPPLETGSNIDCRYLTEGTKLFLPVKVAGALFSCGDGHAAQGDGEVCGTAIETNMKATIRFTVHKGMSYVTSPQFDTRGSVHPTLQSRGPVYGTLGIDRDLHEACKKAVRAMIGYLVATRGLDRVDAYMLTSLVADLQVTEVVNVPHYAVTASLPYNIFTED